MSKSRAITWQRMQHWRRKPLQMTVGKLGGENVSRSCEMSRPEMRQQKSIYI